MQRLPVLTHANGDDPVAYQRGRAISRDRLLAHAFFLASVLPPGRHLVNACSDRYHFCVALLAAMLSERISLFPPAYTPDAIRDVVRQVDDAILLADGDLAAVEGIVRCDFPVLDFAAEPPCRAVPELAAEQHVAWVFTSGSTGEPEAHLKTWGKLVANTRAAAAQLGVAQRLGAGFSLLGTVPPQHMYGFESTILLALQNGGAVCCDRVFFPPEVVAALDTLPRPRILVTTPFHLRNILDTALPVSAVDLLLSATAPLETDLASRAEAAFAAPLEEIYGSTETGQLASRRTVKGDSWRLFPGVKLELRDGLAWASGGHIETAVVLSDRIEQTDAQRFRLVGRDSDMVNVAGKRSSLAYLDKVLLSIEGVEDGAFHLPQESTQEITRLVAFVVAPGLSVADLLSALRRQIDPVFLPRPLIKLDKLPRNATGKLPRSVRVHLLAQAQQSAQSEAS